MTDTGPPRAGRHTDTDAGDIDRRMYALLERYNCLAPSVWHSGENLLAARSVMAPAVYAELLAFASPYSKLARKLQEQPLSRRDLRLRRLLITQPALVRDVIWLKRPDAPRVPRCRSRSVPIDQLVLL